MQSFAVKLRNCEHIYMHVCMYIIHVHCVDLQAPLALALALKYVTPKYMYMSVLFSQQHMYTALFLYLCVV
jgi:hypothetical protein